LGHLRQGGGRIRDAPVGGRVEDPISRGDPIRL